MLLGALGRRQPNHNMRDWCRVWGLGFRVQGLDFEGWCLVFEVGDLGFGVEVLGVHLAKYARHSPPQ